MPANELLRMLRAKPFAPFRMHVSEGMVYEIRHPEMVIVLTAAAIVAFPDPANEAMASGWELVDLRHIIRVEPLPSQAVQSS
ncbi:MAG TPA: hypothetical protein VMF69_11060 [Gemmataceae bacterium]|nr:hypothetical protein [Gemmataceae bacterium]